MRLPLVLQRFRRAFAIEMRCLGRTSGRLWRLNMPARTPYRNLGVSKICVLGVKRATAARRSAKSGTSAPATRRSDSLLLLKLLFTSQPLSIQVHPDDAFAHAMRLPKGKTEAWYVLSAAPEAKVALGLSRRLTPQQFRDAVDGGSISDLVAWRPVSANDVIFVPAGTIHAIGAGLVIAEIQQRSDVTFRLFDYGRKRELHIESAIAVADAGPADIQVRPNTVYRRAEASRFQPLLRI